MAPKKAASATADSLKKRKREKIEDAGRTRKQRKAQEEEAAAAAAEVATVKTNGSKKTNGTVALKTGRARPERTSTWKVSEPMGGVMADIDPIFSADEEHIILAYHNSIQIYTTRDSLLARRIKLPESDRPLQIAAVVLSSASASALWVGCTDGTLFRADWTTGAIERVRSAADRDAKTPQPQPKLVGQVGLVGLACATVPIGGTPTEILFLSEGRSVTAYDAAHLDAAGHVLFTAPAGTTAPHGSVLALQTLRTADHGCFVVGTSGRRVFVGGRLASTALASAADLAAAYQFYVLDAPDEVVCCDVRVAQRPTGRALDLVVGCARGAIYAYEDVFARLHEAAKTLKTDKSTEKTTEKGDKGDRRRKNVTPRKMHWHRTAVYAVKWSVDGNYLVSGGPEEVLVQWQLETGKLAFLPRLTAAIANISIAPTGASYAVHLDDNSAMVLSTAELEPTFYVSGLQTVAAKEKDVKDRERRELAKPVPAIVNPTDAARVLVRVGNGQRSARAGSDTPSAASVQTFDVADFRSVGKQALARSTAAEVATTRRGHAVAEPAVTQLCASADGRWLVSVDEWQPPERDAGGVPGEPSLRAAWARDRREVHLKFWQVGQVGPDDTLDLVSRIDEAHFSTRVESVLGVAADPARTNRFATLGADGTVKFWGTKTRVRDGLVLTDRTGAPLVAWQCTHTVALPLASASAVPVASDGAAAKPGVPAAVKTNVHGKSAPTTRVSGALAYAEDGSTVFAAFGSGDDAVVYTIDADAGCVRSSLAGLVRGEVRGVVAMGASLVLLSADLRVYDMVADELRYGVNLMHNVPAADVEAATALAQLAAGHDAGTFVVAVPEKLSAAAGVSGGALSTAARFGTRVSVFSPDHAAPLFAKTLPTLAVAVLPAVGQAGFMVLDAMAQVWSVADAAQTTTLGQSLDDLRLADVGDVVEVVEVDDEADDDDEADEADDADADADVDMADAYGIEDAHDVVISQEKLRSIFEGGPATAGASIEDLFWEVSGLLAGLPSLVRAG